MIIRMIILIIIIIEIMHLSVHSNYILYCII